MKRLSELLDDESLEVIQEISRADSMYGFAPDLYFEAGRVAVRSIWLAMLAARINNVNSILDFASGAGRVLRTLKAAFPDAALTACDIREKALAFCAEAFGATTVKGKLKPADVELDGPFDVIWCGSLLNHTDKEDFLSLLRLFESVLSPDGVLVFTTHGRLVADALRRRVQMMSFSEEEAEQVVRDYDQTGFGFAHGIGRKEIEANLGDSIASPAWVYKQLEETPDLRRLLFLEAIWLGQDVIACVGART